MRASFNNFPLNNQYSYNEAHVLIEIKISNHTIHRKVIFKQASTTVTLLPSLQRLLSFNSTLSLISVSLPTPMIQHNKTL